MRSSAAQVKDVFHGEMDECWFTEIWQEATSSSVSATARAGSEMIDYRGFIRLFDDTAAEDVEEKPRESASDEEETVPTSTNDCGDMQQPPPISSPDEKDSVSETELPREQAE